MPYQIEEIEGIGTTYGVRLRNVGINSTGLLLEKAGTKKGRTQVSEKTNIPETLIQTWVNHADLMRINGIAAQFAELLEAAGVDSVKSLSQQQAASLHEKLMEVNKQFGLTGRVPSTDSLKEMIKEAKKLTPKVSH
jgi:predicted flap endonuclease-1-like 5' DNA nuclease